MKDRIICILLVALLFVLVPLSAFAVDSNNFKFNIFNDFTVFSNSGFVISQTNSLGDKTTRFYSPSSSNIVVSQHLYPSDYFQAGQSYQMRFILDSSSDIDFVLYLSSEFNSTATNCAFNKQLNCSGHGCNEYVVSFIYSGEQYLFLGLTANSTGATLSISQLSFTRFNPNEKLEGQNEEIISNQDELNSALNGEGSTYESPTFPNDNIDEYYTNLDNGFGDIVANADITNNLRIMNGVKAFALYFSHFYSYLEYDDLTSPLVSLMFLSLAVSICAIIFNVIKLRDHSDSAPPKNRGGKH